MARKYELKARAERQEDTRRRIVEAAMALHESQGPVRTTISDIARAAGVQRHTVYRHFPDERAIVTACSGLHAERNPPPDPEPWLALEGEDRLRRGLREMYAYFAGNEAMISQVLRDGEIHELTREMSAKRFGPQLARIGEVLGGALPRRRGAAAALGLALDFRAWQRLHTDGVSDNEAAEIMVRALLAQ